MGSDPTFPTPYTRVFPHDSADAHPSDQDTSRRRRPRWACPFRRTSYRRRALDARLLRKSTLEERRRGAGVIRQEWRTWLRVLLSRLYQQKFDLPPGALIEFDNLHRLNPEVPKIFFTHDNYLRDFTGHDGEKRAYRGTPVVLLARDPIDVAVSQYFQWQHRMRPHKMLINRYPHADSGISMHEFVSGKAAGAPKVIGFLNDWAESFTVLETLLLVRYEDMRANTHMQLRRVVDFLGTIATDEEIDDAVQYASFENMRKREAQASHESERLAATDRDNPDSYKSRRGKVGGYRDYFTEEEIAALKRIQFSQLDPAYGYATRMATTPQSMSD